MTIIGLAIGAVAILLAYFFVKGIVNILIFCFIIYIIYKLYSVINNQLEKGEEVTPSGIINSLKHKIPSAKTLKNVGNVYDQMPVKKKKQDRKTPDERWDDV